jgi:hypothetical protein
MDGRDPLTMTQLATDGGVDVVECFQVGEDALLLAGALVERMHGPVAHAQTARGQQGKQRVVGGRKDDFVL